MTHCLPPQPHHGRPRFLHRVGDGHLAQRPAQGGQGGGDRPLTYRTMGKILQAWADFYQDGGDRAREREFRRQAQEAFAKVASGPSERQGAAGMHR